MSRQEKVGLWLGIFASVSVIYDVWLRPHLGDIPKLGQYVPKSDSVMLVVAMALSASSIVLWVFARKSRVIPRRRQVSPIADILADLPTSPSAGSRPARPNLLAPRDSTPPARTSATADYIFKQYKKGHTTLQSDKLVEDFKGKVMTVRGAFKDADDRWSKKSLRITVYALPADHTVFGTFSKEWRDRLITLVPGEIVALEGQIETITGYWISLENCKLVDATPLSSSSAP